MRSATPLPVLLTLLIFVELIASCSSPGGNSTNSTNAQNTASSSANRAYAGPKDNVDELMILVRLPFAPEEVAWEENAEKKTLVAVLRFSDENAAKMAGEAAKNGPVTNETLTVESWYPAELLAQSELTGESTVNGQSFAAEPFLNPPYTKGKITRVENTDYFILHASS
ncbi:MAG TPA: hypothetical protein VFZ23_13585 [Pyrinomonadaceae bacterium]